MTTFEGIKPSEVDLALMDLLGAYSTGSEWKTDSIIVDGDPVDIFFEYPDINETKRRFYPSINIHYEGYKKALHRNESESEQRVANDTGDFRDILRQPDPYDLEYQIKAFSRNARDDRALRDALLALIPINGSLEHDGKSWYMYRDDEILMNHYYNDQRLYQAIIPIVVESVFLSDIPYRKNVPIAKTMEQNFYNDGDFDRRLNNDGTNTTVEHTES